MSQIYKALSALLSYPTEELKAAVGEIKKIIEQEGVFEAAPRKALLKLVGEVEARDIYDLQERYVLLFDRTRSLSLHLFEHIHGENRDRGQAMVDLAEHYAEHGLAIQAHELPDYLPLFLEFLSILPADEARDMLGQPLHIISALRQRLKKRKCPYSAILWSLEILANQQPDETAVRALLDEEEDDPEDLEALDKVWEEEAVTFGPGQGGDSGDGQCPKAEAMVAQILMNSPPQSKADPQKGEVS